MILGTRKTILFASLAAAILAAPVLSAPSASAAPGDPVDGAAKPGAGLRGERRANRGARRAMRFLRRLELSEAQKAQLGEARTAAEPVRADARAKIRAILEAARTGPRDEAARTQVRAQVKAVREAAAAQVEPSARRLLESVTPEQRARLAERAAKHGKTLDDAKLLKRIERALLAGRHARARARDAR
jgi:Spy/CpxP family protein refolding chaperone